jgi:2-iminobutanoate/2-iminopropanoate deaminase
MKLLQVFLAMTFCVLCSCEQHKSNLIFHKSHEPARSDVPFSDVVETENLLFLTGQIGKDHKTGLLVKGGIEAETKQVIENIEAVLLYHGLDLDQVVKCTVILRDIDQFQAFNSVYKTYFKLKPARTTFAASGLAGGANIEIDVIAAKP